MFIELSRALERLVIAGCVPLLLYIGYQLFVKGASGTMKLLAQHNTTKGKIVNLAPGSFCFLLAAALGAWVMYRSIEVPVSPSIDSGIAGQNSTTADINRSGGTMRFLGGDGVSFSKEVIFAYAKVGMELHRSTSSDIDEKQKQQFLSPVNSLLKKPMTQRNLEDLSDLESLEDTAENREQLNEWLNEYKKH